LLKILSKKQETIKGAKGRSCKEATFVIKIACLKS